LSRKRFCFRPQDLGMKAQKLQFWVSADTDSNPRSILGATPDSRGFCTYGGQLLCAPQVNECMSGSGARVRPRYLAFHGCRREFCARRVFGGPDLSEHWKGGCHRSGDPRGLGGRPQRDDRIR
jgi:hypothetical protein